MYPSLLISSSILAVVKRLQKEEGLQSQNMLNRF